MEDLRDILADNLRKNRRRLDISQPRLAKMADLSAHYISMIETSRKFPTPEVLARLARALGIAAHELFAAPVSPENTLEKLHQEVLRDIKRVVSEAVEKAVGEQYLNSRKNRKKTGKTADLVPSGRQKNKR
ncbi:MAG: helix-turn-helix transcriptional regulator [Treponema sp.]|nr:helix-turn-helix transcriptional regulator [Treponema sp.]